MSNSSSELAEALARAHAALPHGAPWGDQVARLESTRSIWEEADRAHIMVPPEFVDCITQEVMVDPVITADGHSYERSAIEVWLRHHDTSPMTGEVLPPPPGQDGTGVDKTLRPNHILRGQIIEYRERLARGAKQRVSQQGGWGSTSSQPNAQAPERPRLGLFLHNDQGVW